MGIEYLDTLVRLLGRYPLRRLSATRFRVDLGIRCDSPRLIERYARPEAWKAFTVLPNAKRGTVQFRDFSSDENKNHPIWVEMEVPCRKCPTCLRLRASRWRARAVHEYLMAARTWFCTFTLRPDEQALVIWRTRDRMAKRSICFEQLSADQQYAECVASISPTITKYLKRVRKVTGARIRFMWVAERHKSGYPHFHALVHECSPEQPVRKSVLREQWRLGFSSFKLVETPAAAGYVCKYLSKELATRVRGSLHYGESSPVGLVNDVRPDLMVTRRKTIGTITDLSVPEPRSEAQAMDIMETF